MVEMIIASTVKSVGAIGIRIVSATERTSCVRADIRHTDSMNPMFVVIPQLSIGEGMSGKAIAVIVRRMRAAAERQLPAMKDTRYTAHGVKHVAATRPSIGPETNMTEPVVIALRMRHVTERERLPVPTTPTWLGTVGTDTVA